jgi:hypothetical protein
MEGLKHDQVGTAFDETLDLLLESRLDVLRRERPERMELGAGRSHRARDPRLLARHLARELGGHPIQVAHLVLEPVRLELVAIGSDGVGGEDLGPRGQVLGMDVAHQARIREAELVEAAVEEDPARVEHRPHRPVGDHDRVLDLLEEGPGGTGRGRACAGRRAGGHACGPGSPWFCDLGRGAHDGLDRAQEGVDSVRAS